MNGVLKISKRSNAASSHISYVGLSKFFTKKTSIKKLQVRDCVQCLESNYIQNPSKVSERYINP